MDTAGATAAPAAGVAGGGGLHQQLAREQLQPATPSWRAPDLPIQPTTQASSSSVASAAAHSDTARGAGRTNVSHAASAGSISAATSDSGLQAAPSLLRFAKKRGDHHVGVFYERPNNPVRMGWPPPSSFHI